ncbi:hypothetical protein [Streptomyces rubiginosohelvolus]|uniref:hypothetical protein n=1 Tax=Streptomyces rubiginosohelvolus TaxID=67362 RepID=UPI00371D389B
MSLTSCLKDPASAISRFPAEHLPFPDVALCDYRDRLALYSPPVKPAPQTGRRAEYRMLGHTIDHRLRISLGVPTGQAIREGVVRAVLDDGWLSVEVIDTVQAAGQVLREEFGRRTGRPWLSDWMIARSRTCTRRGSAAEHDPLLWWLEGLLASRDASEEELWRMSASLARPHQFGDRVALSGGSPRPPGHRRCQGRFPDRRLGARDRYGPG